MSRIFWIALVWTVVGTIAWTVLFWMGISGPAWAEVLKILSGLALGAMLIGGGMRFARNGSPIEKTGAQIFKWGMNCAIGFVAALASPWVAIALKFITKSVLRSSGSE